MFRMPKVVALFAGAVVALGITAGGAKAAIFDPLTTTQPASGTPVIDFTGGGATSNSLFVNVNVSPGVAFVNRTISIQTLAGPLSTIDVNISAAGRVSQSNGAGVQSAATLFYDFNSVGGLNFAGVGNMTIQNVDADLTGATMRLGFDTTGDGVADVFTATQNIPTSPANLVFAQGGLGTVFGFFVLTTSSGTNDIDITYGPIDFQNLPPRLTPDIPEPMTLAAFGFMALAGGVVTRRKLKNRVVA